MDTVIPDISQFLDLEEAYQEKWLLYNVKLSVSICIRVHSQGFSTAGPQAKIGTNWCRIYLLYCGFYSVINLQQYPHQLVLIVFCGPAADPTPVKVPLYLCFQLFIVFKILLAVSELKH